MWCFSATGWSWNWRRGEPGSWPLQHTHEPLGSHRQPLCQVKGLGNARAVPAQVWNAWLPQRRSVCPSTLTSPALRAHQPQVRVTEDSIPGFALHPPPWVQNLSSSHPVSFTAWVVLEFIPISPSSKSKTLPSQACLLPSCPYLPTHICNFE